MGESREVSLGKREFWGRENDTHLSGEETGGSGGRTVTHMPRCEGHGANTDLGEGSLSAGWPGHCARPSCIAGAGGQMGSPWLPRESDMWAGLLQKLAEESKLRSFGWIEIVDVQLQLDVPPVAILSPCGPALCRVEMQTKGHRPPGL